MTNTQIEFELGKFMDEYRRVYRYKQPFIPDHFISVIKKNDEFVINDKESTTIIEGFNKELFIKLLGKEELVFETSNIYCDVVDLRTDGCTCGAFATVNPNLHAFICRKYFK